jgi:hypothetical protein
MPMHMPPLSWLFNTADRLMDITGLVDEVELRGCLKSPVPMIVRVIGGLQSSAANAHKS